MPYKIFQQGSKWEVWEVGENDKRVKKMGTHPSKTKAKKQKTALDINVSSKEAGNGNEMDKQIETETNQADDVEPQELYPVYNMLDRADVPYSAKSFADVSAAREAKELMERLEDTMAIYYSLFWSIWNDYEIPMEDKPEAWSALFADFNSTFQAEITEDEAMLESLDDFTENLSGSIISISENGTFNSENRKPLIMDIVIIEPGWGNPEDNHYYPAEVLRRDAAKVFDGAKMYATDHRPSEKNVNTEVGKIDKVFQFSETGAPIARVKIWNASFAENIRNRNEMNELHMLECSILAKGKAKKGQIEGKDANIVEAIIPSKHTNVDFVTKAGAGGRALQLVENEEVLMPEDIKTSDEDQEDEEMQEAEDVTLHESDDDETAEENETETEEIAESEDLEDETTYLSEAEVTPVLDKTNLPDVSRQRLEKAKYLTEAELQTAITSEKDYIKTLLRSGEVSGLGDSEPVAETLSVDELQEDHQKRIDAVIFGN